MAGEVVVPSAMSIADQAMTPRAATLAQNQRTR
jgi:hypothetical protein